MMPNMTTKDDTPLAERTRVQVTREYSGTEERYSD
jgi:hypothetical protein